MDDPQSLEAQLSENWPQIQAFLESALEGHRPPVYLSSDVRDAHYKTASVDINAFPAGFNNLCPHDRSHAATAMRDYMDTHHPAVRHLLLLPENHTRNPYYLHNVQHLNRILDEAGIDHCLGSADPEVVYAVQGTATPEGDTLHYGLVVCKDGTLVCGDQKIDMVLSNNDFTTGVPGPLHDCRTPTIPPPELGWATRSKAKHFTLYNHLATKAAEIAGLEPWRLTVETRRVGPLDFKKREGLDELADAADEILLRTRARNQENGITDEPHVFIKDDTGTYGMGIFVAKDAEDIRTMNSRARQKMAKGKYGHKVRHVIVQEAVPTRQSVDEHPAETVVYQLGMQPVGGFMRVHDERSDIQNLNQPGMRFLPVCIHDECDDPLQKDRVVRNLTHRERLVAQLGAVALVHEATPENRRVDDTAKVSLPRLE
jgi:glutamate--cysteine ligase